MARSESAPSRQAAFIAALIARFHARYPAVEITLRTSDSDTLIDALRGAQLDLALIAVGQGEQPEGIVTKTASDEPIVAVVARTHAWSAESTVSIPALRDAPLITLPRGTEIRRQLEEACRQAGFDPHVAFEVSSPAAMADLCSLGLGVAIMRESLVDDRLGLHAVSIVPVMRARLAVAWRGVGPMSPAARMLIGMAQQFTQSPESDG